MAMMTLQRMMLWRYRSCHGEWIPWRWRNWRRWLRHRQWWCRVWWWPQQQRSSCSWLQWQSGLHWRCSWWCRWRCPWVCGNPGSSFPDQWKLRISWRVQWWMLLQPELWPCVTVTPGMMLFWLSHAQKESPKTNDLEKDELEEDDDEKGQEVAVVLHILSDLDLDLEIEMMWRVNLVTHHIYKCKNSSIMEPQC